MRSYFEGRVAIAIGLALIGLLVRMAGVAAFRRARTTVNSLARVGGVPGAPIAILVLPAFVVCINRLQIAPEERALRRLFGEDFTRYAARVRRWL